LTSVFEEGHQGCGDTVYNGHVMHSLSKLRLMFWTSRYLQPGQIRTRLLRIARRLWWSIRGRHAPSPVESRTVPFAPLFEGLVRLTDAPGCPALARTLEGAREISRGRFCFLNQCVDFGSAPAWHDPSLSQLWRYNLHYFDYVQDLLAWKAVEGSGEAYATFRNLADSWIKENVRLKGDGWHPYTLSLRIVNWIHAVAGFRTELQADADFSERLTRSLAGQALVLSCDLEFDVRGNHLLENIRALIWAGMVLDGTLPGRWYARSLALLERELAEQVPPDGGHFERSPGYHLRVLQVCLETAIMIRRNRGSVPPWLDGAIRRMLDYLVAVLCPDRQVPLLKDTALDTALPPDSLLAAGALYFSDPRYAFRQNGGLYPLLIFGRDAFQVTPRQPAGTVMDKITTFGGNDYFVMRDDSRGDYMIVDGGRPCPDYLPAHAHADLLSFELSVSGHRVISDSGVFEYAAGPWRDYFRSTRAHNTVEVEKENQSEVYGSFRVGRRARPGPNILLQGDDWALYQGSHDGYTRLHPPVLHRRTIAWVNDRFWLVLDELFGSGESRATSHIHFHPRMSLREREPALWRVEFQGLSVWLRAVGHQRSVMTNGRSTPCRQGWYSERFGHMTPNAVLSLEHVSSLPFCFCYAIFKHTAGRLELAASSGERIVSVIQEPGSWTVRVPGLGAPTLI